MLKRMLVLCSLATLFSLAWGVSAQAEGENYEPDGIQYEVSGGAIQFYVSPTGSDAAAGSLAHPFKTVGRAQAAVREQTAGMSGDVVVNLRGGVYRLGSTFALSDSEGDSGENGHRVIYQAYGYGTPAEERPVLSGARAVEGWTLVDAGANVWRADVGGFSTRQLYRNGVPLERGSIAAIPGEVTITETGYTTTSSAPQSWADAGSIEVGVSNGFYSAGICGVDSIAAIPGGTKITMDQPCFKWYLATYAYNEEEPESPLELENPAPIRNSRSFLNQPGTWAIDTVTPGQHRIYYRAQPGENPNAERFNAPRLKTLVSGTGTPEAPIHDISFRGIGFTYSTWLRPSSRRGFVQIYGDYYYDGGSPSGSLTEPTTKILTVPGAVAFESGEDLTFEGNRFQRLGSTALAVLGSKGTVARGNLFTRAAGAGLKLGGEEGLRSGNLVAQNWSHGIGLEYVGGPGIYLDEIVNSTIRHNQVNDVPYSGISATNTGGGGTGMQIVDNDVFETNGVLVDGGGIYTNGPQGTSYSNGAVVEGNVVHDVINPVFEEIDPNGEIGIPNGLYNDDGADFITLRKNVVYHNHQSWGGVLPGQMKFTENFWDDDELVFYGPTEGLEISKNTLLSKKQPRVDCEAIAGCAEILAAAGPTAPWRERLGLP